MSDKEKGISIIGSSNGVRHLRTENYYRKTKPLHRFCSTTSIRAIYRIYNNNEIYLKIFWLLYFGLCVAWVITIGVLTISRYLLFETNTQVKKEILKGKDYPSLTLCTNGFFGINEDTHRMVNHTTEYLREIDELLNRSLDNDMLLYLSSLLLMKTTVFYNINNLIIARNLTQRHLDSSLNYEHIIDFKGIDFINRKANVFCSISVGNVHLHCQVSAYLDLQYRSCINAKIKDIHADLFATKFFLLVQIHFPKVKGEFLNDIVLREKLCLDKFVDLHFHSRNTLPSLRYKYTIDMQTDKVADVTFAPSYIHRLSSSKNKCLDNATVSQNHTGTLYRLHPPMISLKYRRSQVRKHCHCEAYWPPFDRWPLQSEDMCGSLKRGAIQAMRDIRCMNPYSDTFSGKFNRKVDDLHTMQQLCEQYQVTTSMSVGTIKKKCFLENYIGSLIFFIAEEISQRCHGNRFQRECKRLVQRYNTEVNLLHQVLTGTSHFTNHTFCASDLWKNAFPKIKKTQIEDQHHHYFDTRVLQIKFFPEALYTKKYVEVLVHPLYSMIGQLGGATSFFAGITFIVVGEILEMMFRGCVGLFQATKSRIINAIQRNNPPV